MVTSTVSIQAAACPGQSGPRSRNGVPRARSRPDLAPTLAKLGRRVREMRAARDLTLEELARRAQLDPKHFQTIEAGDSNVTVSTLFGLGQRARVLTVGSFSQ